MKRVVAPGLLAWAILGHFGAALGASVEEGGCAAAGGSHAVHEVSGQAVEPVSSGKAVTVRGVITGVFLEDEELGGFFVQGRQPAPDGRRSGLFVYAPGLGRDVKETLEPGVEVRVVGERGVFHGRPQVQEVEAVEVCGTGRRVHSEPPPPDGNWSARWEGVHVHWDESLVVTGNHLLHRYGSLQLATPERVFRPTNFLPDEESAGGEHRITLDDGAYSRYPQPVPYVDDQGSRRVGSQVEGVAGVITHAFGRWRIHPTNEPHFREANPRPGPLPPPGDGTLRVAAFNVENYFLTLGERGAATPEELALQRAKLMAAAGKLDADVLALVELENRDRAARDFVERLADATGHPWRRAAAPGAGSDAIRVGLAYRADRLRVVEAARDERTVYERPPLVVALEPLGGGEPFSVAAIHFKAKVNCPEHGDIDRGQGCWNERRTEQAEALLGFLERWRNDNELPATLIAGDLNAYGAEDPSMALRAGGKKDLVRREIPPPERYTYVYRGESGYLDHLRAPAAVAERVGAVHLLPINADEPPHLEYNAAHGDAAWRRPDAFRSSDHDPVAVDLDVQAR